TWTNETAAATIEKVDTIEGRRRIAQPCRQRSVDRGAAINFSEIGNAVSGDCRVCIDDRAADDVIWIVRDRGWRPEFSAAACRNRACRDGLVSLVDRIIYRRTRRLLR